MAARARQLGDTGINDPKNWDAAYGKGEVHIGVQAFSDSEEDRRRILGIAREQLNGLSVSILAMQDFGAQPGDLNSLGYKDGIDQPAIEGSGFDPLPGQGQPIKAGEFILGYPGEAGVPLPMPQPDILGRNGTYVGFRKYQSRVGAFNRFLRANGNTEEERELLAAKLVGRWRSGAPLTLAPEVDNPALGADPQRNNDFNYSNDPRGRQAPFGCHIRRMNPRDTKLTRLTDVNMHRLIRRGTTYGPPYDPNALSEADDEVPRGAIFLFISAKAMATIEFLQQEWINDGNFIGVGDERDPIIGLQEEGATFTIPKEPVQTPRPRHRNVQRASRRRVLLHAEHVCFEMACGFDRDRSGLRRETVLAYRLLKAQTQPEFQEVTEPHAGPGQVVVKVAGSGLCHTDFTVISRDQTTGRTIRHPSRSGTRLPVG